MSEEDDLGSQIFGWIGTVLALYFFISPVVPYLKLIKGEKTYKEVPGILLLCSLLNCVLWCDYGLLLNRYSVYFANAIGAPICLIFMTMFCIYFSGKKVLLSLFYVLFLIACVAELDFLCYYVLKPEITGIIANVFNVLMYAAPGEKIIRICKTGDYELIPIWSTLGGLACSASWMLYGFYQSDFYLILPNALGVIASVIQVVVYLIFRAKKKKSELNADE